MPDAYSQRGWGTGASSGGGPNIQPSMGGAAWPGTPGFFSSQGAMGGAMGGGMMALLRRRFGQSGAKPGTQPNTGVLGQLGISPEQWVQNRGAGDTSFQQLQGLVDTRNSVNAGLGRAGFGPSAGNGAGFGQPDDILRRLLQARMGGG